MAEPHLQTGMHVADAHDLLEMWDGMPPVRSIITSPPYLDMHDYGNGSRIGRRGQELGEYLGEMRTLLSACFEVGSADATLWLVVGSVRRAGRVIPLPSKLAECAEEVGWTLREQITWDKQKALPWTQHGELRDVTEQVLLLSKGDQFRFDPTELRSPLPNSVWWRRYPERYSPEGRLPTNLWSVPIPTQGSWSGLRTHFCPFPPELTYRLLTLTTEPDDIVLDPFAGVGSVPAMAQVLGRKGYGIELTPEYAAGYQRTLDEARVFLERIGDSEGQKAVFRQVILELRLLKFARLITQAVDAAGLPLCWVRLRKTRRRPREQFKLISADIELVVGDDAVAGQVETLARAATERPPLSKFGIDASFTVALEGEASERGHWYRSGRFWLAPEATRPESDGPHVVAAFRPDPDRVDDTPYG